MMVERYSCTVDSDAPKRKRPLQWTGIFCVLFSLGFIMLSVFYSWFFMIAFAVFFALGAVCIHFYNATQKEYLYELLSTRLTIVGKDTVNRQKRLASILLCDVTSFEIMTDTADEFDALYCNNAYDMGVYAITFKSDGKYKKIALMPDDYMVALINDLLKGKTDDKN